MNLDKSKWIKVKLGDVVIKKEENDRGNAQKRFDRFLKVEHMDAESLHIKRWSSQEKGDEINPTFYKIFRKGQILFPTRNPHLRRAVLASFDGICGEKTLTLEPNESQVLSSFIPFVFHSEAFYEHTTSAIVGSTNPHCRWRDVASFEFLLPPKDQQFQLAELLWQGDKVLQSNLNNESSLSHYYSTVVDNLFSLANKKWNYLPLNSMASINQETLNSKTDQKYEFKYLDLTSIEGPKLLGSMNVMEYGNAPSRAKRVLKDGSTVVALVRPYQQAIVYIENAYNIVSSTGTAVIDAKEEINSRFLFHQFFSKRFLKFCERMMTGTSYPAITSDDLALYKVAIPKSRLIQDEISERLDLIEKNQQNNIKAVKASFEFQKSLINQVF